MLSDIDFIFHKCAQAAHCPRERAAHASLCLCRSARSWMTSFRIGWSWTNFALMTLQVIIFVVCHKSDGYWVSSGGFRWINNTKQMFQTTNPRIQATAAIMLVSVAPCLVTLERISWPRRELVKEAVIKLPSNTISVMNARLDVSLRLLFNAFTRNVYCNFDY